MLKEGPFVNTSSRKASGFFLAGFRWGGTPPEPSPFSACACPWSIFAEMGARFCFVLLGEAAAQKPLQ
jgi:hypothetical protein